MNNDMGRIPIRVRVTGGRAGATPIGRGSGEAGATDTTVCHVSATDTACLGARPSKSAVGLRLSCYLPIEVK